MTTKKLIKTLSLVAVFSLLTTFDLSAETRDHTQESSQNGATSGLKVWPSDESFLKQQDSLIQARIQEATKAVGLARAYLSAPRDSGIEDLEALQMSALNAASRAVVATNKDLNKAGCSILGKLTERTCRSENTNGVQVLKSIVSQSDYSQTLALMPHLAQNLENYENQVQSLARIVVRK